MDWFSRDREAKGTGYTETENIDVPTGEYIQRSMLAF